MIVIDDNICFKYDLEADDLIKLLVISRRINLQDTKYLESKKLLANGVFGIELTDKGKQIADSIICRSVTGDNGVIGRIDLLVPRLQEIFPEGKKPGTNYYWRGNKTDIRKRLISFFKRYNNYTDEQIIKATEKYVSSFNGNYDYMRLLMYFIWKVNIQDGIQTCVSNLSDYIENDGKEGSSNSEWTVNVK